MKFFIYTILLSNYLPLSWIYPYDVQDIPEPFYQLSCLYSKLHNQQPKSDDPNIVFSTLKTLVVISEKNDLLVSSLKHLHSKKVGIQHAYEYNPYLLHLLEYEHSQNYIFESANHDNEYLLAKHNIGISFHKQCDNSNCLLNVNSFDNLTFNKTKTFIETKVTAMKLQGFNL